ncbi:hypothetical protein GCM10022381_20820 [Leifsonia kafniensis]|uniref:DUF1269 domain-containing protein n=1 Tax=Leifsonia kafniensis TaxID=475957 RepID=A0ABP7KII7_9MICO
MTEYAYGPVEILLLGFDGNQPRAALREALADLVVEGSIRLLDLLLVSVDETGGISSAELEDGADGYGLGGLVLAASGVAADEDILEMAAHLAPGTSAALAVIEHTWARQLASALAESGGYVIHTDRIPAPVVNAALAELAD